MKIICECGHSIFDHGREGCQAIDSELGHCHLSPNTVEARYFARENLRRALKAEQQNATYRSISEKNAQFASDIQSENHAIRHSNAIWELAVVEAREQRESLQAKLDKVARELNDATSINAAHYLEYLDIKTERDALKAKFDSEFDVAEEFAQIIYDLKEELDEVERNRDGWAKSWHIKDEECQELKAKLDEAMKYVEIYRHMVGEDDDENCD